jgi:hypothetical protein
VAVRAASSNAIDPRIGVLVDLIYILVVLAAAFTWLAVDSWLDRPVESRIGECACGSSIHSEMDRTAPVVNAFEARSLAQSIVK